MATQKSKTNLTEFDMMVIREGGRTQAEIEESALKGADFRIRTCAILADALNRFYVRLVTGGERSFE